MNTQIPTSLQHHFSTLGFPKTLGMDQEVEGVLSSMRRCDGGVGFHHNILYKLSLGPVVSHNDHTDTAYWSSGEPVTLGVLDFVFEEDLVVENITQSISANGNPLSKLGARVLKRLDELYGPCEAAVKNAPSINLG